MFTFLLPPVFHHVRAAPTLQDSSIASGGASKCPNDAVNNPNCKSIEFACLGDSWYVSIPS
jgi:hypothetical protein